MTHDSVKKRKQHIERNINSSVKLWKSVFPPHRMRFFLPAAAARRRQFGHTCQLLFRFPKVTEAEEKKKDRRFLSGPSAERVFVCPGWCR